jgi:hypothetical protein
MGEPPPAVIEVHPRDDYLEARYLGTYSLQGYRRQIELTSRACNQYGKSLLLVDITDLQGYSPTTFERHEIGTIGASLSRHLDRVAMIGTSTQIERDEFATTVARNRGLSIETFLDRDAALRWLLATPPLRR